MWLFRPNIRKLEKSKDIIGLAKCLESRKPSVRSSAFVALSGLSNLSPEIKNRMKTMLKDPDSRVKTIATLKFAELGDKSVSDGLLEIMNDGTISEKIDLLQIISSIGKTEDDSLLHVILLGLIDKKETVRIKAVKTAAITKSKSLVPKLGELLLARHHKERLRATKAIFIIGGDESIDYLLGLMADTHPAVKARARLYLEQSDNPYTKRTLDDAVFMQLIKNMNGEKKLRERTAYNIGVEQIRAGLPLLYRASKDKYKGVRIQALRSISLFKNKNSVEVVEKLLSDRFYQVRIEALNALERIGGPGAMKAVKGSLNDRSRDVSARAKEILGLE